MAPSENICPVCKESNDLEDVVCGRCGALLEDPFLDPGAKTTNIPAVVPEIGRYWSINEAAIPEKGIAIYVEGEFNPAYIDAGEEFVLGRKVGATSEISQGLLDLSPMGGYSQGLSRKHAVVRWTEHGYEIMDLGSANGTWLNEEKLAPQKYYPLASGSHLRLGSMRLVVRYHPVTETKQNP